MFIGYSTQHRSPRFRLFLLVMLSLSIGSCTQREGKENNKVWFRYPGKHWNSQGLHLGNGYFGATFLGGVQEEVFSITDASMWTGGPANGNWEKAGVNPPALQTLPRIRKAVGAGLFLPFQFLFIYLVLIPLPPRHTLSS